MTTVILEDKKVIEPVKQVKKAVPTIEVLSESVDLLEDCVRVSINGMEKFISYASFLDIVRKRVESDDLDNNTGSTKGSALPKNCIWLGKDSKGMELNFYYPECTREIIYYDKKIMIRVPNIMIYHQLTSQSEKEYSVSLTKYFCTDLTGSFIPKTLVRNISHPDRIFLLPFSNTYEEANMCYGYNSMPRTVEKDNLRQLNHFYEYLFMSPFNDDLGIRAVGSRIEVKTWYNRLADVAKANGSFPYDQLRGWTPAKA